ncbi:MAG TPA: valine--tRNA ligase [Candidatus Saccharimonadales bacterium]|nr:valine--tRNA ligase [Candidatus Saccharimonadales bacterium]
MQLPKAYDPSEYEADIYALWEKSGAFTADPTSDKERFSIAMPPPNETGTLSLGHALFLTLQDITARYQRLQGKDVLWLPGTDHAALAVNAIIERKLTEEGTTKHEIGREAFLARTREFVAGSRGTMLGQMRAMGASADWSRLKYTLDPALTRAVGEVFTKMYNDGLIYRGHRIVNWDPNLETNVSDDEVVYEEETAKLYTFKYGPFEIATARPETKFGDKYVVVHPDDKRYKKWKHGDTFTAEWINGPVEATVIKDESIDPGFGTGVMTITPWHSHVDFEIAERHGLDKEQIIDFHGKLLPIAGEFTGLPIAEARPKIVEKLAAKGLLLHTDDTYVHNIAHNERGKGIIEPQIRLQWFIDVNKEVVEWQGKKRSLKQVLQSVIREGDVELMPGRFEKVYFHWIDNLRDWCISRQIWWGHRIPAWYRTDTDGKLETYVGLTPPTDQSEGWNEWEQDPDTLDTWFSSALWTWSTLIDPALAEDYSLSLEDLLQRSPDFQAYHPTSFMETGWDILFFWVARMILSTTYATGQVPFKTVYLHGMVRAADGKKMSKSRPESIIDPLDVIGNYGTDALRMALIMSVTPGNDQNWQQSKIEANRNFCNKLWNIARYCETVLGDSYVPGKAIEPQTTADHWVLQKLQHTTGAIARDLDNYQFSEAYDKLYHFIWDDVADWYIEASKSQESRELLGYVLENLLKLAHPFAPFVTETIWQTLYSDTDSLLIASSWPKVAKADAKLAADFEQIRRIVTEARALIKSLGLAKPNLYYTDVPLLAENAALLGRLAGLDSVREVSDGSGLQLTSTTSRCWLDVDSNTLKTYSDKLTEQIAAQERVLTQLKGRLDNKSYVANAPKAIVEQSREQLGEAEATLERLTTEAHRFGIAQE